MTNITVNMDVEDFINLLNERKEYVEEHFGWISMPDCLWEYFTDVYREVGSVNASINEIVDNAIVNGDYGEFDNYKWDNETDEEFIERVENNVFYINAEERIVCFSI